MELYTFVCSLIAQKRCISPTYTTCWCTDWHKGKLYYFMKHYYYDDDETLKIITMKTGITSSTPAPHFLLTSPLFHSQPAENSACSTPKRPLCWLGGEPGASEFHHAHTHVQSECQNGSWFNSIAVNNEVDLFSHFSSCKWPNVKKSEFCSNELNLSNIYKPHFHIFNFSKMK